MKNTIFTIFKTIMIAAFSASLIACASSTQIKSDPASADLYVDGEKVGKTPYTYTDTRIVGSVVHLKMKKEGFEDLDVSFNRSEEPDVGAIVGGVFALVPFLWTMKYKPVHSYELVAKHHQDSAPVQEYQQSIVAPKTTRKSKKH
jgi:hypothetical protein